MKKVFSYFTVGLATSLLAAGSVDATNLKDEIKASSSLGDVITYSTSYDEANDVTNLVVTLSVDTDSIDKILSQKSGNGSYASTFYFELNPNLAGTNFKKNSVWVGSDLTSKTIGDAKTRLGGILTNDNETVAYDEIWPNAISVEYYDEGSSSWKLSNESGISIKQALINALGVTEEELVYGENFRFTMYDEYTLLWAWEPDGDATKREYVNVDWEIKFPVATQETNKQVLFASLDEALASGSKEIIINKNLVIDKDLEIPEDVTITVSEGATLEIKEGNEFVNHGTVVGTVKVYYDITTGTAANGTVTVDKATAAVGDTVTVTTTPAEGYELDKITVTVGEGTSAKEVTVTNGKFEMPEGAVKVTATFKVKAATDTTPEAPETPVTPDSPETSDNIGLYLGLGVISLAGTAVLTRKMKRYN